MPGFFDMFLRNFGLTYRNEQMLFIGLIIAWLAVVCLRLFFAAGYKTQLKTAQASASKGINHEALDKLQPPVLRRAALDYADLGERGIARIDAKELLRKSARKLKVLWWSYESAGRFLKACEWGLIIAGIVFTALSSQQLTFAVLTLLLYFAGKLLFTFFDYEKTKDEFFDEMAFLLDRDIGKFYITDGPAAINNLRSELKNLMTYQAKYLSDTITELKDKLASVSEKTLGDTAAAVQETLQSVAAGAETVLKPLEEWRLVITDSKKAHEELNLALVKMSGATDGFKERLTELERLIDGYKTEFMENNKNVESSLSRLCELTTSIADLTKNAAAQTEAVQATLEFVQNNQGLLKDSINQYEIALKDISAQTGEGLGKIIEYHAQNSYKTLTDNAIDNVRQAGAVNAEMMGKLQSLIENLLEQSKNETSLILNLKEQMETEYKMQDVRNKKQEVRDEMQEETVDNQ